MSNEHLNKKPDQPDSRKGFGVAASPFNGVKVELGIILFVGLVLWLAADSITDSFASQLMLLGSYGIISASWLIFRTRRILHQQHNVDPQDTNHH